MELRDYQDRIVTKAINHIANEIPSVCITSPTGSGKSVMALAIAEHLANIGMSVGWVAMRRNLLRQAANMNQNWNKTDIHFISMFDNKPPRTDVLILDECVIASTKVTVLKNGKQINSTIGDVMVDNTITHVLSMGNNSKLEFKEITSKTNMGTREIYEVIVEDDNGGEHILYITGNGKIYSGNEYVRVDKLHIGSKVKINV